MTGLERLKVAYEFVRDNVKDEEFDLDAWYKSNCKTVGCFCGWAATCKTLQEEGLDLVKSSDVSGSDNFEVTYDGSSEFYAATKFFELRLNSVAQYLFYPGRYSYHERTRGHVLARVKSYIDKKEAELSQPPSPAAQ